jgi:hypothetical protein
MKGKNTLTPPCPECFGECTERYEKELYRYKGGAYFYNSHFWRCVNGHEFQMGDQMQKSLKQCEAIKKIVDNQTKRWDRVGRKSEAVKIGV